MNRKWNCCFFSMGPLWGSILAKYIGELYYYSQTLTRFYSLTICRVPLSEQDKITLPEQIMSLPVLWRSPFHKCSVFFFCCLVFLIFSYICVLFCWLHCRSPPFLFSRLGHAFGSWCHTLALTFTIIKQMKGTKAVRLCTLQSDSHLSFVEGLWSFSRILVLIKSYRVLNEEL